MTSWRALSKLEQASSERTRQRTRSNSSLAPSQPTTMSAPSFSSFPPSFASFPELDSGRQTPNEPSGSHNDKRREKRGHKADRKSKHDNHYRPKKHTEDGGKRQALGVPLEPGQGSSKRVYYSDPKGDPLNVLYGGLHAGDVPKHHLVGRTCTCYVFFDV